MIVETSIFNKIQSNVGVDRFKYIFKSCDGKVSLSYNIVMRTFKEDMYNR